MYFVVVVVVVVVAAPKNPCRLGLGQNISKQQQHLSDPFRKGLQKTVSAKMPSLNNSQRKGHALFLAFPKPNKVGYELSFLDLPP